MGASIGEQLERVAFRATSCPVLTQNGRPKKAFDSEEEATQWEANNRAKWPGQQEQYAYKCDSCPYWHLTSKAGRYTPQLSSSEKIGLIAKAIPDDATTSRRTKKLDGDEIRRLHREEGLSCADLARRYKVTDAAISYHLHPDRLPKTGRPPAPRVSLSLSSIENKKAELQLELQRLEAEETRLRELKALKVAFCWDGSGIVIEKETNKLALPISDAQTLIDKITELLTQPEAN